MSPVQKIGEAAPTSDTVASGVIGQPVVMERRPDSQRHAEEHGHREGGQRELHRGRQELLEILQDRPPRGEGLAEIAPQDVGQVGARTARAGGGPAPSA